MRFIRVTSIAIGFLCLLASGPLRAEIVPGTILSPDTTVMLPNFDGHITWERGSSTNFDTLDALLCRQGEESWHFVSFFSEATEVATGQLEPGVAMECKVRTRSVENQSEWVDSESRMWAVDPSWSTFEVEDVTLEISLSGTRCDPFIADIQIRNTGMQGGIRTLYSALHPAGSTPEDPVAIPFSSPREVALNAGQATIVTLDSPDEFALPALPGQWSLTIWFVDATGFGEDQGSVSGLYGADLTGPTISYFDVLGQGAQQDEIAPGSSYFVDYRFEDDFAVNQWAMEWRPVGGNWLPVPGGSSGAGEAGACLFQVEEMLLWTVPGYLAPGNSLELRLRVWDALGNMVQTTKTVALSDSAGPEIYWLSPTLNDTFVLEGESVPVHLLLAGVPAGTHIELGWTNAAQSLFRPVTSFVCDQDVEVETSLPATHAGDKLFLYAKIDSGADPVLRVSPRIRVNFPDSPAPWGSVVVPGSQLAQVVSGDLTDPVAHTQFDGMVRDGDALAFVRQDRLAWTEAGDIHVRRSARFLRYSPPSTLVLNGTTILNTSEETVPDYATNPGLDGVTDGDWLLEFAAVPLYNCNPQDLVPCDFEASIRITRQGVLTDWQVLGTFETLMEDERPRLDASRGGAFTFGGFPYVQVQYEENGVRNSVLFRRSSGAWSEVATHDDVPQFVETSDGQLHAFRLGNTSPSGLTAEVEFCDVDGVYSLENCVPRCTVSLSTMEWWVDKDRVTGEIVLMCSESLDESVSHWRLDDSGVWHGNTVSTEISQWKGQEILGMEPLWFFPSDEILYIAMELTLAGSGSGEDTVLLAVGPDVHWSQGTLIPYPNPESRSQSLCGVAANGEVVRIVDGCVWNLEDRLCLLHSDLSQGNCFDGDLCTEDVWNPLTETCEFVAVTCEDDEDLCNGSLECNPDSGLCEVVPGTVVECLDATFCDGTVQCEPASGTCVATPLDIDDGVVCTQDLCNESDDEVVHVPDDTRCLAPLCFSAQCNPGSPQASMDGCVLTPLPIPDDGLACTHDQCNPDTGEPTYSLYFGYCLINSICYGNGDPNPTDPCLLCKSNFKVNGWSDVLDGTPCSDGFHCTESDSCVDGVCIPGAPMDCSYLNTACQTAQCDETIAGCKTTPLPAETPCGEPVCDEGILEFQEVCNGAGSCGASAEPMTQSCEPYAVCADELTCADECQAPEDCFDDYVCRAHACEENKPPVADAGADQEVDEDVEVTLDGSASSDLDGDPLSFHWTVISEMDLELVDFDTATPRFLSPMVDAATEIEIQLVVNDGFVDSEPSLTFVTVGNSLNAPPVAQAGSDQVVDSGDLVELDGTNSYDPEGESLTYSWSIQAGPEVTFDDPTSPTPSFVAPSQSGSYVLTLGLVVNDGIVNSDVDKLVVSVLALPPEDDQPEQESDVIEETVTPTYDTRPSKPTGPIKGSDPYDPTGCQHGSTPSPAPLLLLLLLGGLWGARYRTAGNKQES